jgi:glycosyltransferase involved in cell wall biosynthesis
VKVVHVPFGYFPDLAGGTEVYVAELARGLSSHGIESVVAAPASDASVRRYEHDGTEVRRFPLDECTNVAELYGEGDEGAARAIASIIDEVDADVLHLHAFTRAASLSAARLAKRRGAAVVFTYHTPTASCVRGTLLRDGREPCDGRLVAQRCAACLLESRGVPFAVREALSRTPRVVSELVASSGVEGPWATALRARELAGARHSAFEQLLRECDAVIAVCDWVRTLLLRSGAPPERLVLSRQGTRLPTPPMATERSLGGLRLAFAGRLHAAKGVHLVIRAIMSQPELRVELDIYGVPQDAEGVRYREALVAITKGDSRIRIRQALPPDRVVETLATYDATVVPSQWLETGPLTVLESFAAGVPVIGSNLGGIAELVAHDGDGWLVSYADEAAWASALRRLATDPSLVDRLRRGVRPPRSTVDVARDMAAVYASVVPRRTAATRVVAGVA